MPTNSNRGAAQRPTQEIPAWSANLCTNAPRSWRDDLRAEAERLGISYGELLRQLLVIGAALKLPALAKKLVAAHEEYYPNRSLRIATLSLLLLTVFVGGSLLAGSSHHVRAMRVNRSKLEWCSDV